MAPKPHFLVFFLLFLSFFSQYSTPSLVEASATTTFSPSPAFVSTIRSALSQIQILQSLLSTVTTVTSPLLGADRRVSSAVKDCIDVLSLSSDELQWTLSATSLATAPAGGTAKLTLGTGHQLLDVRSWLSAALGNQETCAEGFEGTDGTVKSLVSSGLENVSSLIYQVLIQVPMAAAAAAVGSGEKGGHRKLLESGGLPSWMDVAERRLLQETAMSLQPDVVVAADGSGDYETVQEAVDAAPQQSQRRYVIYVKSGRYRENVEINKKKWNIVLFGDGMGATVISGNRNFVDGWTTFRSATLAVVGKGFIMRDLTVENTAGASKHQAVALRTSSDLSVYFRVEFAGYQDTLYSHSLRQFYRECRVSGTIDFIFGNAAAVIQSSAIAARRPLPNQKNTVTAHGRKYEEQSTGFSIHSCNVTFEEDAVSDGTAAPPPTYLGRPWKKHSRTVVMMSYLAPEVRPEGWMPWAGNFALDTLYYGEYMNNGPGSATGGRVKWRGFHIIDDAAVAVDFTVAQFIDGDQWLPPTGVRYTAGLTE
ncbi:hypothetical protein Taro_041046 [Colocasia esculenta]|uniref:Pectinesterase n=1 Tax=Colocasia esculenta TaxID=4460 RepID=A0A843WER9_COLES|nr:hypothetical protein [Colocasia esculenta]